MASDDTTTATSARVSLREITKAFAGIPALKGVDLEVRAAEIHALCGENGAGKSTLIGILGGVLRPDSGTIELEGETVRFRDPADALARGVAVIHQECRLVDTMTVAENVMLGDEPHRGAWIDRAAIRREAKTRLETLGFAIDPKRNAGSLPVGARQLVEIAKAIGREARVLVLDEPTAALTRAEAARLFDVLADLKRRGLAIVFISHHLDDVQRVSDRITVLRDGRRVGTWNTDDLPADKLMTVMVGSVVDHRRGVPRVSSATPILQVENATAETFHDVNLTIHPGEILGLSGLAGAGHEELASALFGSRRLRSGRFLLDGKPFAPGHPSEARRAGIGSVPADRRREGLVATAGVGDNATLAILPRLSRIGWVDRARRRREAVDACREFEVTCASIDQAVLTLSGGNQQKTLLARWCLTNPRVLILNEPTRGIDVRTREAIHRKIETLADAGLAIVLVTADTQELLRLADRLVIFRAGTIVRDIAASGADEQNVLAAMIDDPRKGAGS
jgi:ABC-type sugar transport system ATPase subunit